MGELSPIILLNLQRRNRLHQHQIWHERIDYERSVKAKGM